MWLLLFEKLKRTYLYWWPLLLVIPIFVLLLARNPFSERNLIANFEPFPDAFYYVIPPKCWLAGEGWHLCRDDYAGVKPTVPPLYSLVLLPMFIFTADVRAFYFINVLLSFLSLYLLFRIIRKITTNSWAQWVIMTLFITQYHIYWYPSLAMAENMIIPLVLLAIDRILSKDTWLNVGVLLALALSFYVTKYAYAPILAATFLFALWKSYSLIKLSNYSKKTNITLLAVVVGLGGGVVASQWHRIDFIFSPTFMDWKTMPEPGSGIYFSLYYVIQHLKTYFLALLGEPLRMLWHMESLLPIWSSFLAVAGILLGAFHKKHRRIALIWLIFGMSQILFISSFYTLDARYVFHLIPLQLMGLAVLFDLATSGLYNWFPKKQAQVLLIVIFLGLGLQSYYLLFPRLKHQIAVNLKYEEQPWWYLATQEMNTVFSTQIHAKQGETPYLITLINPYMHQSFGNHAYRLLPLSEYQDYQSKREEVWGVPEEQLLIDYYQALLEKETPLYITNYGISASDEFQREFKQFSERFELEIVSQGCFDLCNVYQLKPMVSEN